ncbi:MAG: hypothetical protein J0M24_13980 [Verrucomicrobia bacterium]|nr:hypothetical protein [Verrucomicrobiota bacterium]
MRLPKSAGKAVDLLIQDHQRMEFMENWKVEFLTSGGALTGWIPEPHCFQESGKTRREVVDKLRATVEQHERENRRMRAVEVLLKGRKG